MRANEADSARVFGVRDYTGRLPTLLHTPLHTHTHTRLSVSTELLTAGHARGTRGKNGTRWRDERGGSDAHVYAQGQIQNHCLAAALTPRSRVPY